MKLLDLINEEYESEEKLTKKAHAVYKFLKTGTIEFHGAIFKYVLSDTFDLNFYTIPNEKVPVITPHEIIITRLEDPNFPYRHRYLDLPSYQAEMYLQRHCFFKYNIDIDIPDRRKVIKGDVEFI